jgi:hypothetical protein
MTTAKPLARYRAIEGALASGFVTAKLHHAAGHDRTSPSITSLIAPKEYGDAQNRPRGQDYDRG